MSDRVPSTTVARAPANQAKYQVRFDLGLDGLDRIGDADVLIWVDALALAGDRPAVDSRAATVISADLTTRSASAAWVLAHQVQLGRRVSISIVGAGGNGAFPAVDVLAAGAVIDALISLGIDFTSPEAAVACAAFSNLRNAVGHLFTASVDGQSLIGEDRRDDVVAAARIDSSDAVRVLRS